MEKKYTEGMDDIMFLRLILSGEEKKITISDFLSCPLLDKTRTPLSFLVWQELEKQHPANTRKEILDNFGGAPSLRQKKILHRNLPDNNQAQPIERKSDESDPGIMMNDLEFFLTKVFVIDWNCNNNAPSLKEAIDILTINSLPDKCSRCKSNVTETYVNFKQQLARDVKFLQDNYEVIGRFSINNKLFTDFDLFRTEFLNITIQILQKGEIPKFDFGYTLYDYLVSNILEISKDISHYLSLKDFGEEFEGEKLMRLLSCVYDFAVAFEHMHFELYDKTIIKGQQFNRTPSELKVKAKTVAIKRKKELLSNGYSSTKANAVVQSEFENMPEYQELFKDYGVTNWKVFLQESKNGKTR